MKRFLCPRYGLASLAFGLFLAGAAAGCQPTAADIADGDDPLEALTAGVLSTRYDGRYWLHQRSATPEVFGPALTYCKAHSLAERPNCQAVMAAWRFAESLERPAPKGRGYSGILTEDNADLSGPDTLRSER
jgi:hypothetical protein